MDLWWDDTYPYRMPITINAGGYTRIDKVVDAEIDLTNAFTHIGFEPDAIPYTLHTVEVDDKGKILNEVIPFQCDLKKDSTGNQLRCTLSLYLAGTTPAEAVRRFYVYFCDKSKDYPASRMANYVSLTDGVMHEGQESYKIATPAATYIYHKFGAGFASLLDSDGVDWISFHPWGGSDGKYRGIPNLVYPEGYFHPGNEGCRSRIISSGPIKVKILSTFTDGLWTCTWDVTPQYATLTVLKTAQPYWFLYEGTPGGKLDEKEDYIVRSTGTRTPASVRWEGAIPDPE